MFTVDAMMQLNLKSWDDVIAYMNTAIEQSKQLIAIAEQHKRKGTPFPTAEKNVMVEINAAK